MSQPKVVHRYRYDPLDRLIETAGIQRFYNTTRMATEIQGAVQHSVFQGGDVLLAQTRREGAQVDCTLLATDFQRSVLHGVSPDKIEPIAYNVYGHRPAHSGLLSVLGFNGERPDPVTGHYLLGNGYRAFNPLLMRFNSPDSWSPFGEGGINCYGYCGGDPSNNVDADGHFFETVLKGMNDIFSQLYFASFGVKLKAVSNIRKLRGGVHVYDQGTKKGLKKIVFDAHSFIEDGKVFVGSVEDPINAHKLVSMARESGVKFEQYDSVKLLICHSAGAEIAQNVSNLTGLKTKGFKGTVAATYPEYSVPNMEVGKIYQPINDFFTYRNTGAYKYAPQARRNYDPVRFLPDKQKTVRGK